MAHQRATSTSEEATKSEARIEGSSPQYRADGRDVDAAVRADDDELAVVLETLQGFSSIVDERGIVLSFRGGDPRHELAVDGIVGRHARDLMPTEVWRSVEPVMRHALATRRVQEHQCSITHGGRIIHLASRVRAFGDPPRLAWHTRDVSAEVALQEMYLSLHRFEGIALYTNTIAHDLASCVTAILGGAEFVRKSALVGVPEPAALDDVISASLQAAELCRQLLGISNKQRSSLGFVNLSRLCEEMLLVLRTSAAPNVHVTQDLVAPEMMPVLIADDIQLRQIIFDLLLDAAEPVGERVPGITVRNGVVESFERAGDQWVFFEVESDGRAIDPEMLRRLLEPLASLSLTTAELALAATFKMVRGQGGVVELGEGHAGGRRVRISLPVEPEPGAGAEATARRTKGDAENAARRRNALVVVVSADATLSAACRHAVELAGHRAQELRSMTEAFIAVPAVAGDVRGLIVDAALAGDTDEGVASLRALTPTAPFLLVDEALTRDAMTTPVDDAPAPLLEELAKLLMKI